MSFDGRVLRRGVLTVWLVACVMGALNHTVAEAVFGTRLDLPLPNQKYGYVMFNRTPRVIQVTKVLDDNGEERFVDALVATPTLLYKRARWALNLSLNPGLITALCRQAALDRPVTLVTEEYAVAAKTKGALRTRRLRCLPDGRLVQASEAFRDAPR